MKHFVFIIFSIVMLVSSGANTYAQQQNFLTASGNKLFDTSGQEVRLTGVNWFGFETSLYSPHGIWSRDTKSVLKQIKDLGFNTIRIPWCNEMLNPDASVLINSYGTDPYSGVSPMNEEESMVDKPIDLLDIIVKWCQENDIKIVLDNHSRAADGFLNEKYWYTATYSEKRWIDDWVFLANRYKNFSTVVAMDLNNEPHGSTWGNSNPDTDWNKAAERCGNAILAVHPDVLIIVEGVGKFEGDSYWWGGQLKGAKKYPVQLSNPSKLFYSAHEYGSEVAQQDWFESPNFPSNMPEIWKEHFHYLYENNTSPLFIGEFGIRNQDNAIAYTWYKEWMNFMGDIYSWTFWTMNPNSGDTGGILKDDWTSVNQWKMDVLSPHFAPLIPNVIGGNNNNLPPLASIMSSTTSGISPLEVSFDASGSSDPDGDNLTYAWSFGNGEIATEVNPVITYTVAGSYTVTLTVNDGEINSTPVTKIINVVGEGNLTPVASFETTTLIGEAPLIVSFDASGSSDPDGDRLTYVWSFGNGEIATEVNPVITYTAAGSYTVTLTVNDGQIDSTPVTKIVTVNKGEVNDCTFGLPLLTALPSLNGSYQNIYILGNGGPNLDNVTDFTINWDLNNNGLYQFSMNTNNGTPDWYVDFLGTITRSFNTVNPDATLSGTGIPGLDGSYWVAVDAGNFVMVSKTGDFTLYFSTSSTAPNCNNTISRKSFSKALEKTELTSNVITLAPNPVQDMVTLSSLVSLQHAVIRILSLSGRVIMLDRVDKAEKEKTINLQSLQSGMYIFEIINLETGIKTTKKIIKE